MAKHLPTATFHISADAFPGAAWREICRELGVKTSNRSTTNHPIWRRIDGRGFTIWLSEVHPAGTAAAPTQWRITMDALAPLSPEGEECWHQVHRHIIEFFKRVELRINVS